MIPYRACNKKIPKTFGKRLHRGRARVEQAIGKLKRFKRIVLRCEKTRRSFGSFVAIAVAFILAKSVHTA
ncbi:MAG: transposase [Geminicoccaceae bacterium]